MTKQRGLPINIEILRWAIKRANLSENRLNSKSFSRYFDWLNNTKLPNLTQLVRFAKDVSIPVGYLFLEKPITENLPIIDFRSFSEKVKTPSINLLETIQKCQIRQEWYSRNLSTETSNILSTKCFTIEDDFREVAKFIRNEILNLDKLNSKIKSNSCFRKELSGRLEKLGVMVLFSGIVEGNTNRKLDIDEFRDFSLYDKKAPLIFVNSCDSYSAQNFTIIHEFGHILLRQSGVSDIYFENKNKAEIWCNNFAAHVLLPSGALLNKSYSEELVESLSTKYNISKFVAINRMYNSGFFGWDFYQKLYANLVANSTTVNKAKKSGGDYYLTKTLALSSKFVDSVLSSVLNGETTYREGYSLLNVNENTFQKYLVRRNFL